MHPYTITTFRGGLAVVFRDKAGKRRRFALEASDRAHANPEAAQIVKEFFELEPSSTLVEEIWNGYQKSLEGRPTGRRMKTCTALTEFFGGYRPVQIDEELVDKYIAQRFKLGTGIPVSQETLWTELGLLRDAINWGRKKRLISLEDVPLIKRPSKPAPRDRPLSHSEAARLLAASRATPHLFIAIQLMLGTAGRLTAVLELTWDRVDFQKEIIDLRVDHSGPRKGRAVIPMNAGLRDALLEWRAQSESPWMVTWKDKPIKSLKTAFGKALARTDLEDVRLHDLRHTAAVWMLQSGSSIQRISQYLGHSSIAQTEKVYARYQPGFLREEAEALDLSDLIAADSIYAKSPKLRPIYLHETEEYVALTVYKRHQLDLADFVAKHYNKVAGEITMMHDRAVRQSGG